MPDSESGLRLEIGHVLFIDLVGYSKLPIEEQKRRLRQLTDIVLGTAQVRETTDEQLVTLPTGDGMALVFRQSAEQPVRCALEIAEALQVHSELPVRMGVHSGPVSEVTDLNSRTNIAGAGINMAQRVMDCSDAGHILLSKHSAEDLEEYEQWRPLLHDLGSCEVKHGVRVGLVNLYNTKFGNPQLPKKLQAVRRHRNRLRWAKVTGAVLVLAALGAAFLFFMRKPVPPVVAVMDKSIAVLPFENLSSDTENVYFTDGVQDEVLSHVARIADLKVISRTSVMHYKSDAPRNLREIGQQLGVAHLLEGSVQRAGNKVRVIAQLIDSRDDAHIWAQTYDGDLEDVFAIQSQIARAIAEQLRAKLSASEESAIQRAPTTNVGAFDLYSRAKNLLLLSGGNQTTIEKNLPPAIDLLQQAIARDSNFFLAHCLLAFAHDRAYFFSLDRTPARLAAAQAALDTAARLGPGQGETHLARAYHFYWGSLDYAGALEELESARRTLPNEARISELSGYILRRQGKHEEGVRYLERALELDPRNFLTLIQIGVSYFNLHRYAEAAASYDRALAVYPDNLDAQLTRAPIDIYWKADTRAYRRVLDELRQRDAAAYHACAVERFDLAEFERDVAGAEAAVDALGDEPRRDNALVYNPKANAGLVARWAGNEEKARGAFIAAREEQQKVVQAQPSSGPALALLGLYNAALGRKEEALRNGQQAMGLLPIEKDAFNGALVIKLFTIIAAWVGEKELALEYLARAVQLPGGPHYGELKLHPNWDSLRGDPRFEALVASLAPKEAK